MPTFLQHWPRTLLTLLPLLLALMHASGHLRIEVLNRLDAIIYDARLKTFMPQTLDDRVVVVDIDEQSLAEVGRWPFFGTLARLQRTVFVERQRRSATGETRDAIRDRLLAGDTLLLFPEGTSHDGNHVLPFKSALLGAAEYRLEGGGRVKVQPVSTAFTGLNGVPMGRENRPFFAWYGDMEMVPHLWEALLAGPLDVTVQFHPPFSLDQMNRNELAARAERVVREGQSLALAGRC